MNVSVDQALSDVLKMAAQAEQREAPPSKYIPPKHKPSTMVETKEGADKLNEQIKIALIGAHDHAISQIDEMITKLQSVKQSIELQKSVAIAKVENFISSVDKGLSTVMDLEKTMSGFVNEHLAS